MTKQLTTMDYEKLYKEALERAKDMLSYKEVRMEDMEYLFPELAKSEDERIRKAIIKLLNTYTIEGKRVYSIADTTRSEMLDWLEKQGEKSITIDVDKMVLKYSQTMDGDFGLPVECQIRAYRQGINDTLRLEKQGDQKPYGQREECSDCQVNYAGECKGSCELKRNEQKSTDKVEPKFKVGDWIITEDKNVHEDYRICRICKIDNDRYYIENGDFFYKESFDNYEYRLWTIQDAKDGDVLYAKGSYFKEYIFMFSSVTEDNVISTHFGYDAFHKTFNAKLSRFGRKEDFISVTPATKEQRDLLFSKMKEAGYGWDAEKKELKKIEQSIEIPFGAKDSELQEASYYIPEGFHAEIDGNKVVIKKGEQKPAWSEEDNSNLGKAIWYVENPAPMVVKDSMLVEWLKSIKERIKGE